MIFSEMAMNPTIAQLISTRDFAISQSSCNPTDLLEGHQTLIARSYLLIQESQDRQTLTPLSEESASTYHVKLNYRNGPIFRKPHMVITKEQEGRSNSVTSINSRHIRRRSSIFNTGKEHGKTDLAVVELDVHGTEIEVIYKGKNYAQNVGLSDPVTQTYTCSIDGLEHQWRPLGPSRSVLELVGSREERVALFLYAEGTTLGDGDGVQRRLSLGVRHEVGELYTLIDINDETRVHEEVLCSALAVVESRRIA